MKVGLMVEIGVRVQNTLMLKEKKKKCYLKYM